MSSLDGNMCAVLKIIGVKCFYIEEGPPSVWLCHISAVAQNWLQFQLIVVNVTYSSGFTIIFMLQKLSAHFISFEYIYNDTPRSRKGWRMGSGEKPVCSPAATVGPAKLTREHTDIKEI